MAESMLLITLLTLLLRFLSMPVEPPTYEVLFLHGGGWEGVAPAEFEWSAHWFEDQGYDVTHVMYTLSGEAPHPAQIHDVFKAMEESTADRIILLGASSGGHLASLAGTAWNSDLNPYSHIRPYGVISLAGPPDPWSWGQAINDRWPTTMPAIERVLGGASPEEFSAVTYADWYDPDQYLVYSPNDIIVPWWAVEHAASELVDTTGGEIVIVKGDHALRDAPLEDFLR